VTEAVVDLLETVEVDEDDGEALAGVTSAARHRHLHPVPEELAVGQVGQRVVAGVVGEPLLGRLALRDVDRRAEHAGGGAQAVEFRFAPAPRPAAIVETEEAPEDLLDEDRHHRQRADLLRFEDLALRLRQLGDRTVDGLTGRQQLDPTLHADLGGGHVLQHRVVDLWLDAVGRPLEHLGHPTAFILTAEDVDT